MLNAINSIPSCNPLLLNKSKVFSPQKASNFWFTVNVALLSLFSHAKHHAKSGILSSYMHLSFIASPVTEIYFLFTTSSAHN